MQHQQSLLMAAADQFIHVYLDLNLYEKEVMSEV
jgi:hypothetical protein